MNLWHVVVSGGTTTYTLRNYQGCLKETSATDDKCNACDTALGYSTTPVVSGSVATCNCDTGYTKFTDSATNDPINAWYPINPLSCIFNAAVTDNCFEYLDSRRCKRCKARYALTPIGTCEIEPADGSANKLANC